MTMQTPQEKVNATVAATAVRATALATIVKKNIPGIARRLPAFLGDVSERYAAIALDTVMDNPGLCECTPESIVRGIVRAAEYGLAVDGVLGHAYLVPYRTKSGIKQAEFQIGYRGIAELMYRTGMWDSIATDVVCVADGWKYQRGLNPILDHTPALSGRGKPPGVSEGGTRLAAYAIAYPKGGGVPAFVVLGEEEILANHRAASKAYNFDPKNGHSIWHEYPDVAWKKSAMRELSKVVALATDKHRDVRRAAVLDQRIDAGDPEVIEAEVVIEPAAEETKATKAVKPVVDECPPGEAIDFASGART